MFARPLRALRPLAMLAVALTLAACKADKFDVDLATGDLAQVARGSALEAPFEMVFSDIGDLDDEKRAQFARFEEIMRQYMAIDSFLLVPNDNGTELQIEGRLPVTAMPVAAPYFLELNPSADFPGYWEVEMKNGADYTDMEQAMRKVSFMLTPDRYQPTRINLAGNGEALIVPGAWIDSEPQALWTGPAPERIALSFKDGIWDDTGAKFLVKLP